MKFLQDARAIGYEVLGLLFRRPVVGAVAVAVDPEGRIVLIRRRDTGTWGLPGGMVSWGEQLEQTLSRELREETGYTMTGVRRLVGVYSAPRRDPRVHSVAVLAEIAVRPAPGPWRPNGLEVLEVRAFAPQATPAELAHDARRMLDDWRAGGPAILD